MSHQGRTAGGRGNASSSAAGAGGKAAATGATSALASDEYRVEHLNLLAFNRAELPVCELTGAPATVQLVTKHNTIFYANEATAEQAWFGIVSKVDHLLGPLTENAPVVGTSDERRRRQKMLHLGKKSLIEFCMTESSKLLNEQRYHLAIPGAIQALKFSKDVYGDLSIEVVEPYLSLAQISLGTRQLSDGEKYLAQAKWNIINSPNSSDQTKSRLHSLSGQLYLMKRDFEQARVEFAQMVYYSTRSNGAESVAASVGYCYLGEAFLSESKVENALASFDKVVDIWYKYLSGIYAKVESGEAEARLGATGEAAKLVSQHLAKELAPKSKNADEATIVEINTNVSFENQMDGHKQLNAILEHRRSLLGSNHIATGEVHYTLGLFEFFFSGDAETAAAHLSGAKNIYSEQLGPGHPSTLHVSDVTEVLCGVKPEE